MVIFGAGGDLTKRLLVPALYNLARTGLLPNRFNLLGVDRIDQTADDLRAQLRDSVDSFAHNRGTEAGELDETAWNRIAKAVDYVQGDITKPDVYHEIGKRLDANGGGTCNALFYLAIGDRFFAPSSSSWARPGWSTSRTTSAGASGDRKAVRPRPQDRRGA